MNDQDSSAREPFDYFPSCFEFLSAWRAPTVTRRIRRIVGRARRYPASVDGVRMLDVPTAKEGRFERILAPLDSHPLKDLLAGGPARFPESIETRVVRGTQAPYAVDRIELPRDNPWKALTPEWLTTSPPPVENWHGEPPLVHEPYGYGVEPGSLSLAATSGREIWAVGDPERKP